MGDAADFAGRLLRTQTYCRRMEPAEAVAGLLNRAVWPASVAQVVQDSRVITQTSAMITLPAAVALATVQVAEAAGAGILFTLVPEGIPGSLRRRW